MPAKLDPNLMFQNLYDGKRDRVVLSISVGDTRASPSCPDGVYALEHHEFVDLCDEMAKHPPEKAGWPEPVTGRMVAWMCDQTGVTSRWFRLSDPVARWIESTVPIMIVDGIIA